MKAVPTTFVKVSNIKHFNDWIHGPSTFFRFVPAGRQEREVLVRGSATLRDGMHVVAALYDKDDWSSIVGWKDLETGSITAKSPKAALRSIAVLVVLLGVLFLSLALGVSLSILNFPILFCLYLLWQAIREWRQSRQAWQCLGAVTARGEA